MDFGIVELDPGTRQFWDDAREALAARVTPALRELTWGDNSEHDWDFHRWLGDRGWITYAWPESEGGIAATGMRGLLLGLELWRCGAPGLNRVATVQIADSLRAWLTGDVRREVLGGVAAGTVLLCQGITEPGSGSDAAAASTRAVKAGDGWVINGQKMFTTNAHNSQYCFLLTRTDRELPKHRGLTVFLVPMDSPGIEIAPVATLGSERTNMVFLDDVRVDDRYRVGEVNDGWRVLNTQLDAEHGQTEGDLVTAGFVYTEMLRELFESALAWAREPGRGSRPLDRDDVATALAEIALDLEVAAATPEPTRRLVASELFNKAAMSVFGIVGPAAVLPHGQPDAIMSGLSERALRQAPATSIYGGTTEVFRNIIAEQQLGLPRHRRPFAGSAR